MTEGRAQPASVVVVGGGFAGVAAAWAAVRAGAHVTLLHASAGASAWYNGVADGPPLDAEALELAMRLGIAVSARPRPIATREGVIRSVIGRDRALLDLEPLAGLSVAVADVGRDDWDAALLARSYTESAWARRTRTEFVAVRVDALEEGFERRISAYDFGVELDVETRVHALANALRRADGAAKAWLLGPWLGVASDAAPQLAALLSRPVGEVSSAPGGVAGARFELRRDEVLRELGVVLRRAHVTSVESSAAGARLQLGDGSGLAADAVVLALGGVAAGGILLEREPASGRLGFALSLSADVPLKLDAEWLDAGSSVWGPSFVRKGLGALERVGVSADVRGRLSAARLFAAGDCVAGRPRTVLEALSAGLSAGRAAAGSAAGG